MKNIVFLFFVACFSSVAMAQLTVKPKCGTFVVDIINGKVNNIKPDFPIPEIKEKLPCFTSSDSESVASSKCGGTVFYKDRDVYFYTERDYIEIGEKFKGRMSMPLFTTLRAGVFKYLGRPLLKDDTWEAFETAYGLAVLHYNKAGKVSLIQLTTKGTQTLKLCE